MNMRAGGITRRCKLRPPLPMLRGGGFDKTEHHETAYRALIEGMPICAKEQISSLHATFCTQDEYEMGGKFGLLQRETQQFHWYNQGSVPLMISWARLPRANAKTFAKNAQQPKPLAGAFCN